MKEKIPLSSVKYFRCIQNRLSYGSRGQYGRPSDSESHLYKANTKSNYDSYIILTGSGRFCYNNKADLIRVSISGNTNENFEIITDQNYFDGQGGNFSFFDNKGATDRQVAIVG